MTPWLDASLSVHNLHDIEMFERTHLDAWRLPHNIFDAIETRSHHMPTAPAIRFLPNGDMPDREIVVTYEELVRDITRTANFLRSLGVAERSEEYTSALQSIMRISYAVFCL